MRQKVVLFVAVFLAIILSSAAPLPSCWAADFSFAEHWRFPVAPQGPPPKNFSDLEASLNPDDCGTCHEKQYEEWQTSLHSKSMGPGVTGQFYPPWLDKQTIFICYNCHAPLAEQSSFKKSPDGNPTKNQDYLPELQLRGIICAGCHVRLHIRYGPKPLTGKVENPPHNSFVEVENFGNSEFCKPCHQFNKTDNRVNGKLLQNTYEEWKKSGYPGKDIHCPDCHMPERQHLWRGIHSPEMVKSGVKIETKREDSKVFLEIINNGVGHNFPTYVTPKIVIRGSVMDKNGKEIPQSVEEKFIGWNISLNIVEEFYDTRIPPGETFRAQFQINKSVSGKKFRIIIRVFPDDFYTRFYKTLLDNPPEGIDMIKIKEAYNKSMQSNYVLFEKFWDI